LEISKLNTMTDILKINSSLPIRNGNSTVQGTKSIYFNANSGNNIVNTGLHTSLIEDQLNTPQFFPAVVGTNDGKPNINYTNLQTGATVIQSNVLSRRRDVTFYTPEEQFCIWNDDFHTSNDSNDTTFASSSATFTRGQNRGTYSVPSGSGASSATLLATGRLPVAQFTSSVTINSHNATGSYNDVAVGYAITTSSGGSTITDNILCYYRRTTANPVGNIQIAYTYNGGTVVFTGANLTTQLSSPVDLMCILNYNSIALAVGESGRERILMNVEIPTGQMWLENATTVSKLRPLVYFQSDGPQNTVISNWKCRANGSLGDREHYTVTFENGEPVKNKDGLYYITADACHVNIQELGTATPNSEYERNQSTCRLYNADMARLLGTTAKYAIRSGNRVFGAQQSKIVFDRRTGLFHWYSSKWNDAGSGVGPIKMTYRSTYQNILHGYWIFDDWQYIDLTGFGLPLSTNDYYDTDVIYYNGRWYMCGTVTGTASSRSSFLVSGPSPNSFTTLHFVNTAATAEGTRFWIVGGNVYVVMGDANSIIRIMDLSGTILSTFFLPGGGRYPHQASMLPHVKVGKTQYQVITFGDGGASGEDYIADGSYSSNKKQSLAFGPTVVTSLGTFDGEEFTQNAFKLVL
jgi:hypothetical protein